MIRFMFWPSFIDKYFPISFGCSICLHLAAVSTLLIYATSPVSAGKSGGSQVIYDIDLEGFGLPGISGKAGELSQQALPLFEEQKMELKMPASLPVLKVKPAARRTKAEKKIEPMPPTVAEKSAPIDEDATGNSMTSKGDTGGNGSDTPGSYGTGGGVGGGDGSGNNPQGAGKGAFARAVPLSAPKPPYPSLARQAGFEGRVILHAAIGSDGKVRDASVQQSSGRGDCDDAAVQTVLSRWKFEPARLDGAAIESKEKIVVVYNLQRF